MSQLVVDHSKRDHGEQHQQCVDDHGGDALLESGRLQGHIDAWTAFGLGLGQLLDRDASEGGWWRDYLGSFQDARPVEDRIGEVVEDDWRLVLWPRELNDLAGRLFTHGRQFRRVRLDGR